MPAVDRYLHTGSLAAFKATFLSGLSLAFFGIGLYRLWYQFNFYNLHFSADMGMVTVGANIARVAVMALLVLLAHRNGFSRATRGVFAWSGFVLMTASSVLYLIDLFFNTADFEALRVVVGGVGLVGGEVIWVFFLERLRPGEAFFYAAGGLALSCALSLAMGYLDPAVSGMVNLFVPALSVFAYWQAMARLDERGSAGEGAGKAPGADTLYEQDPLRRGVAQTLAAFFLYAFLLGMALGYPDGRERELSQAVRSIHQVLVVALVALVVWLVLVRGRSFRLSGYWLFQNALMMASICFLMSGQAGSEEASAFLLTNAVTCFYIPLVFFSYCIGRHVLQPTTIVYAVAYGGSLLCMAAGRIVVYAVGPALDHGLWLLIAMAIVALVEATLVMRPRFMGDWPVGFELCRGASETARDDAFEGEGEAEGADARATGSGRTVESAGAAACGRGPASPVEAFAQRFGLSETEEAIVSLIAQGRSRAFIARALSYSENTIRNYTRTVYRKAQVHSKQELLDKVAEAHGEGAGLGREGSAGAKPDGSS
ncbi:helix-turn-helix transcriptional regulator [Gordonibacter sp. An230]|uniref:helix-turn-helix transcriptional regulator n=1 Tax=Gordonibacter sp. An230 TaxID=1965592 RepID=UPI001EF4A5D3|nr:LuxR C-terminal-related transcriptional regulator [Gordonibacter sp. An230]